MTEEIDIPDRRKINAPSDVNALLEKWITTATVYSKAHREAAIILQKRHMRIGAPSVGLSAVVGTSIFAAIQEVADTPALKWTLALLSMGAAALAALLTFYNFAEKSASHRIASEEYNDVARRLDLLKTSITQMPPSDWRNVLEGYSQRLEAIGRRADIPESMIIKERHHVQGMFESGTRTVVRLRYPHLPQVGFPEELEQVFLQNNNRVEP
jgi:hypothetical protein